MNGSIGFCMQKWLARGLLHTLLYIQLLAMAAGATQSQRLEDTSMLHPATDRVLIPKQSVVTTRRSGVAPAQPRYELQPPQPPWGGCTLPLKLLYLLPSYSILHCPPPAAYFLIVTASLSTLQYCPMCSPSALPWHYQHEKRDRGRHRDKDREGERGREHL